MWQQVTIRPYQIQRNRRPMLAAMRLDDLRPGDVVYRFDYIGERVVKDVKCGRFGVSVYYENIQEPAFYAGEVRLIDVVVGYYE